jgi:hypothetical protein
MGVGLRLIPNFPNPKKILLAIVASASSCAYASSGQAGEILPKRRRALIKIKV